MSNMSIIGIVIMLVISMMLVKCNHHHRESSRSEGSRSEGSRSEGSRSEGSRSEGSRSEGSGSNWDDNWNNEYSEDERKYAKIMFCSDCEYIKGDVERYNECANRDYGEHHKRLSNHRSHYKKDRKQGHRNCYKDFQESMRSFNQEGGYNKFNQCFRNNLNKEHIRRCENNEYE